MVSFRIREFISTRPESILEDPDRSVVAACHLTAPRGRGMNYSKAMPTDAHVVSVHLQGSPHHMFTAGGNVLHDAPVTAGTVSCMPSGEQIQSIVSDGFDVLAVFIPCWFLDNIARRFLSGLGQETSPRFAASIGHDKIIYHLACAMLDCLHMPEQPMRAVQFNALSEAFASRLVLGQRAAQGDLPKVRGGISSADLLRIRRYIDQHLDEPISVDGLANMAGLSRFHFARAFKISTGEAPYRFIQQQRLRRAHDLLRGTNLPITDIAAAVGYDDPGHFAKVFRRFYGTSPRLRRREA